jgi:hypothetical protein
MRDAHIARTRTTTRAALRGGLGLGLTGLGLAGLGLAGAGAAGGVSPVPPTVTVNPNNVMVNTDTHVVGRNFSAGQTLTLVECGKKSWIVPKNPCDSDNTVTVTTNGKGNFQTDMKVEACPGKAHPPGLEQTCYIGVEKFGIDIVSLQPFASIVVTFP